jgi:hypothetical protein
MRGDAAWPCRELRRGAPESDWQYPMVSRKQAVAFLEQNSARLPATA